MAGLDFPDAVKQVVGIPVIKAMILGQVFYHISKRLLNEQVFIVKGIAQVKENGFDGFIGMFKLFCG